MSNEPRYTVRFTLSRHGARVMHFTTHEETLAFVDYLRHNESNGIERIVVQSPTRAHVVNFNAPRITQVSR